MDAFGEKLLSCQCALYRYARSLTRDPERAGELVQECYRKALQAERKPSPATGDATRAWLFTILRNHWHSEVRQASRTAELGELEDVAAEESLERQVTRRLLQSEVRDAMDALPEPWREIILLRDVEGLGYQEIARVLGCPVGTVMSRLARARGGLRRLLGVRAGAAKITGGGRNDAV